MGDISIKGKSPILRQGFAQGGRANTRRENRLEELGRVDAEKHILKKAKEI